MRTLDLGETPLANELLDHPEDNKHIYPLEVLTCTACWHGQLSVDVEQPIMYDGYNYVSGTTDTLKIHFQELARTVALKYHEGSNVKHLDLGANDGSLMAAFSQQGFITAGIDPAQPLRLDSFQNGFNIHVGYWSEDLGIQLSNSYDVITACNVFAHNPDPFQFLNGCHHALKDDGYLIIEFPYAPRYMLDNPTCGHYYHEHQNYFTVNSFLALATRSGFWITDIEERPIHGGSIRLWLQKADKFQGPWLGPNPKVQAFIDKEKNLGLYKLKTYVRFEHTLRKNWDDLAQVLLSYQKQGYFIVGYGASAKSTTLLNGPFKHYLNKAPKDVIEFIIDDNPRKGGKFTPGSQIYIANTKECHFPVSITPKMAFLNLAYNFKDEIKERIKRLRPWGKDDILIEFVPKVNVSNLHD